MPYRTAPKEEEMRLSLTRGEVHKIVLAYLQDTGKIPEGAKIGTPTIPALDEKFGGGYLGAEKEESKRAWHDWICMMLVWTEPDGE